MFGGALLIVLLTHTAPYAGQVLSDRDLLTHAEKEFREGVNLRNDAVKARPFFRRAANDFEELSRHGARNAVLYRYLGNAYLLAGDLPQAILSYRRGLQIAPDDPALRAALVAARERVVYPASGGLGRPRTDPRPPWLPHVRAQALMIAAGIAYVLSCIAVTRWRMVRRGRVLAVGLIALLLSGMFAAWLIIRTGQEQEELAFPLVVICRDSVLLRRGDSPAFPPRYNTPIHRGVEARRLFERDGWLQIELAGGEIGWVPRSAVLVDAP